MGETPPSRSEFPFHVVGFYTGVASVMLSLTHVFNFLPLPFMQPLGALAWFSLVLGGAAVAMGFVAQRQVVQADDREMARNAMVAGGAGVALFAGLFVLGLVIGRFLT
jgi:hypothetical protein